MGCKGFPVLVEVCSCHFLCAVGVGVPVVGLSLLESRSRAQDREEGKIKKAIDSNKWRRERYLDPG